VSSWLRFKGWYRVVSGATPRPSLPTSDATSDDRKALESWDDIDSRSAGAISLALSADERNALREHLDSGSALWSAIKARHVVDKPTSRYNAYSEFFGLRLAPGEKLDVFAGRVVESMRHIQQRRPEQYDITKLDKELTAVAVIRALAEEPSCRTLVATLLSDDSKLGDVTQLRDRLVSEDISRETTPALYGLQKSEHGVLLTLAPPATAAVATAAPAAKKPKSAPAASSSSGASFASSSSSTSPKCAYCGKLNHTEDRCYKKRLERLEQLEKQLAASPASARVATAPAAEFAGSATTASPNHSPSSPDIADNLWIADTGATAHMSPHRQFFATYESCSTPVRLADGNIVMAAGVGTVAFVPCHGGVDRPAFGLERVLHVPALCCNLISVLHLVRHKGFSVCAETDTVTFSRSGAVIFTAHITPSCTAHFVGKTLLAGTAQLPSAFKATISQDLTLWHRRTMHHHYAGLQRAIRDNLVTGVKIDSPAAPDPVCEPCLAGKMHADPFPSTGTVTAGVLDLVCADLVQMPVRTASGFRYFVGFHDDCSDFHAAYPLKTKDETFDAFCHFKSWAELQTGRRIRAFQDDKGGEFVGGRWDALFAQCGIEVRHSTRNRPQQNGKAERANRTILEAITAALAESGLPGSFWGEALASFIHVWNRLPSSSTASKSRQTTPYELWYNKKPDLSHLRVWGCRAYVHIQRDKRTKLEPHMQKCIFIGYPADYRGWRFWDPDQRRVIVSERADFDERYFPLSRLTDSVPTVPEPSPSVPRDADTPTVQLLPDLGGDDTPDVPLSIPAPAADLERLQHPADLQPVPATPSPRNVAVKLEPSESPDPLRLATPEPPRRSGRMSQPPRDWRQPLAQYREPTPAIESSDEDDSDSPDPLALVSSAPPEHAMLTAVHHAFLSSAGDPRTLKEALAGPNAAKWELARIEEMAAHERNGTWELVYPPPGVKLIGCRLLFKTKYLPNGEIDRHKVRLVAQGFTQRHGVDYFETYASTAKMQSIRTVIALAAALDLHLHSIDVSNAYLNGDIDADVYMRIPEGYDGAEPGQVCKLRKALYGTKQGARAWQTKMQSVLVDDMGFASIYSDTSIYVFRRNGDVILLPVFVDDATFASNNRDLITEMISRLESHFKLRDLGETTHLLGISISRDLTAGTISLSQRQYVIDALARFNMSNCHPVSTPMVPGLRLSAQDSPRNDQERDRMLGVPYGSLVGTLLYLAMTTRPDIAYAVSVLCRFISNPGWPHWLAAKHLLRYLKGTQDAALVYRRDAFDSTNVFSAYCDADHAGNADNGRSTGGYVITIAGAAVSWASKLQSIVALSTTEAEYIAAVEGAKEVIWLRQLLSEFGLVISGPSALHIDNQAAISVSKNPEHHGRMKHLDIRFYWLRDQVEAGLISPEFIPTLEQPADTFTKSLARVDFERCRPQLGIEL
jgi:transposase InsO family protein